MNRYSISRILSENALRHQKLDAPYNPVIGDCNDPNRFPFFLKGLTPTRIWLPSAMSNLPMIKDMMKANSLDAYIRGCLKMEVDQSSMNDIRRNFTLARCQFDFPFWAASFVRIKNKNGGPDIPFLLNFPQRLLVEAFENQRAAGIPVRLILLKARQWGGSTCVQLYMVWFQLIHDLGLNSLIVAHNRYCAQSIADRLHNALRSYPAWLLGNDKLPDGKSGKTIFNTILRKRNCKAFVASADRPQSCRGFDLSLVHCSEVAFWRSTALASPYAVVQAAFAGVPESPNSMIVLESTANGKDNFFYDEYLAASRGVSCFKPFFIPWFMIPEYSLPVDNLEEFASRLLRNRQKSFSSSRSPSGAYLWSLWQNGASLEAIAWYIHYSALFKSSGQMKVEFPSSPDEAFHVSGRNFISAKSLAILQKGCFPPLMNGEVIQSSMPIFDPFGSPAKGRLGNLLFSQSDAGPVKIWEKRALPEFGYHYVNRYVVVAVNDISGVVPHNITVFDRLSASSNIRLKVVAQCDLVADLDTFAWEAAKIAKYHDNAILIFASLDSSENADDFCGPHYVQDSILMKIKNSYPNFFEHPHQASNLMLRLKKSDSSTLLKHLASIIRNKAYCERDPDIPKILSSLKPTQSPLSPRILSRALAAQMLPLFPNPRRRPLPNPSPL